MNAHISNAKHTKSELQKIIEGFDKQQLMMQEVALQAASNAISHLLVNGCTEQLAIQVLASLKLQISLVKDEFNNRGESSLFATDQTNFN